MPPGDTATVLFNGRALDGLPPSSRGLAYGDGLFETLPVFGGMPLWLDDHLERICRDGRRLGLTVSAAALEQDVVHLLSLVSGTAVIKITVFRQATGRGYAPTTDKTDRIVQCFDYTPQRQAWRDGIAVMLCQQRLSCQATLAGIKHLNRLEQVLAADEISSRRKTEGLMLDTRGRLVEATRSNVFLVENAVLLTPDLRESGVSGIMRNRILRAAAATGIAVRETNLYLQDVYRADEVFVCNSVFGIWPVVALDCMEKNVGHVTRRLQSIFEPDFYA